MTKNASPRHPQPRPAHLERLAMCKYMVGVAAEQLHQPDPRAAIALLTYHDAVELFLVTAADYLEIVVDRDTTFLAYWKLFRSGGRELPFHGAMKRLNDARIALKHHGHVSRRADLEEFRVVVSSFCDEAAAVVFGIAWAGVSMADYVTVPSVRDALKRAEQSLPSGNIPEGLSACAEAFDELVKAIEKSAMDGDANRSPFDLGQDMRWKTASGMGLSRIGPLAKLAEFVDATSQSIQALRQELKIVMLGIDYRRYTRFKRVTPFIETSHGGKRTFHQRHRKHPPSLADLQLAIEFVFELALRFQADDRAAVESSP